VSLHKCENTHILKLELGCSLSCFQPLNPSLLFKCTFTS